MKFIKDFRDIDKQDIAFAGGKGASLGEMTRAGTPVPPGFVVSAGAFDQFCCETNVGVEINAMFGRLDTRDIKNVDENSEITRTVIMDKEFPEALGQEIFRAFDRLGSRYVAVRSSATAEDSKIDAWAGQLESYLYVEKEDLLKSVQRCWASLFTPRALVYRVERGLVKKAVSVAVVIQKMIASDVSGVCFTVHPVTQDRDKMIIEACWGLGEALVQGIITPDSYVVAKSTLNIVDSNVSSQEVMIVRDKKGAGEKPVPVEMREKQKLTAEKIRELARIGVEIERHYKMPMDLEWAMEKNRLYIVQARPITTLNPK